MSEFEQPDKATNADGYGSEALVDGQNGQNVSELKASPRAPPDNEASGSEIAANAPGPLDNVERPTTYVEDERQLEADSDLLQDFPDDCDTIDVSHMKIASMKPLGLSRFHSLKSICFRQNLLTSMQGLEDLPEDMEEIDFYDNRLSHMDHRLEKFGSSLKSLDLSFNNFRHIKHLQTMTGMQDLYLCQNDIGKIVNLECLTNLTNLELGANRIKTIKGLETLVNLEQLWLARNKITRLEGLDKLKKLRLLSIQSNRISKIEGLEELTELTELYIAYNHLEKIEGLDKNTKLSTLDVSNNRLTELSGLDHLQELEELWASGNQLTSFENVEKQLKHLPKFNTIYLEQNPLQRAAGVTYRNKVRLSLGPSLQQIDATPIR